ncbi:MAG: BrxE family protein [Burkholderiales bacterium]|jgi:hypothetical protein|nr:BrxE family protein [Burkholderiales bacterium]
MMSAPHLGIVELRLLVAFLGERAQYGWWNSAFFEPASRMFLEPIYPKTARLAQYHGAVEAAKRLHDERIGVGQVFHLFRLPEEMEQDLHARALELNGDARLWDALRTKDEAVNSLRSLAAKVQTAKEGPYLVGPIGDLASASLLSQLAGGYLAAFQTNVHAFPYLSQ